MRPRLLFQLIAAALCSFAGAANVLAISAIPATVQEFPGSPNFGSTEYMVNNTSSAIFPGGKFDISVFLSTTTGASPTTTNSSWSSETVDATDWTLSMGFPAVSEPALPTWQQYTGMTYTQAFPGSPTKLNGYFLNFTFDSDTDTVTYPGSPLVPGAGLGGFFFTGDPSSTFLVLGPADSSGDGTTSFTEGDVVSYSGTSTDVPEPASLGLLGVAIAGITRRGARISHRKERRERGDESKNYCHRLGPMNTDKKIKNLFYLSVSI